MFWCIRSVQDSADVLCSSIIALNEVKPKSLRSSQEGFPFGIRDSPENAAPPHLSARQRQKHDWQCWRVMWKVYRDVNSLSVLCFLFSLPMADRLSDDRVIQMSMCVMDKEKPTCCHYGWGKNTTESDKKKALEM